MTVVFIARFVSALQRRRQADDALVEDVLTKEVLVEGLLPVGEPLVTWRAWCVDPARGMHLCSDVDEDDPGVAGWQLAVTTNVDEINP